MPECFADVLARRGGAVACLLVSVAWVLFLLIVHVPSALLPLIIFAMIFYCRRSDPWGALLYVSLLSLGGFALLGICFVMSSLFWPSHALRFSVFLPAAVIVLEGRRFLDNEYGDGRLDRRLWFAALCLGALAAHTRLTWM